MAAALFDSCADGRQLHGRRGARCQLRRWPLCGYGPPQSDTRRFSSRAVIPGVGVLQANRCRHHRSDSDGSRSFIPAPALLPSATHHTERRVASARWRSPSSVPPAPRAGGRTPVTTPFGTVGEGLQRPQRFQCLPTKPDERAQYRWPPVSGASTPILPRVRSISEPAIPFMPSDRSARIPGCCNEPDRSAHRLPC